MTLGRNFLRCHAISGMYPQPKHEKEDRDKSKIMQTAAWINKTCMLKMGQLAAFP